MLRIEDLHTRASLVALTIKTWSARRFDRALTLEVTGAHGVSGTDAGRFNKRLLASDKRAGLSTYKALIKVCNATRSDHYANTLAWGDDGFRLLPMANYDEYTAMLRGHEADFHAARAAFVGDYDQLVDEAKIALGGDIAEGGMFRASDYPKAATVGDRFQMAHKILPLPSAGDFRVALPEEEIATLQAAVTLHVQQSADAAMTDARERLVSVVENIATNLGSPDKIFRNSLIENARDLTDVLSRLNVMADPEIEEIRQRVERELTAVEPDDLREQPTLRKAVAKSAEAILAEVKKPTIDQYTRRPSK